MEGRGNGSPMIRPISKGVVHRICAGQVVLDLSSAVKELVENSLDAGATSVEIALKEYGLDSIQVIDNGSGISPKNFQVLALKHHTSKLLEFPDLQSLTTFGFRGEALSSLCALGELTVETRTVDEVVATHLTYDRMGVLAAERKSARQVGTTVTIKKLFSNLPVRSKEFKRNIRKEYGKLISLLNAYALIAKGVRLVCTNTTAKNVRSVVLKTQGSGSLKDNIITVFGLTTYACLEPLSLSISDGCVVEGFVSKSGHGSGRNIGDRQFIYVNNRPVDMPKVGKLVNELYRTANSKQYPIAIMNFLVPTQAFDVNVTPDKRKIFISDESSILQSLREALQKVYSSNQVTYSVNGIQELKEDGCNSSLTSSHQISQLHTVQEDCDDTIFGDDEIVPKTGRKSFDKGSSASIIQGFALKDNNQTAKFSTSTSKKPMDDTPAKTERLVRLDPELTRKGSISDGNSLARSNIVQASLEKFVTVSKRKLESVNTALSEIPLLRNGPSISRFQENSSSVEAHPRSSENCTEVDDCDNINRVESRAAKISKADKVSGKKSIEFPSGRKQSGLNEGDARCLFPCDNNKRSGAREEQKIQERVIDADSVRTTSIDRDSKLPSPDILDETIPLQPPDVPVDSPLVPFCSKVAFTLQFSMGELMSRRKQMLSRLKHVSRAPGRLKLKGGFAAATLELSQMMNEEGKATALAAATRELERLFKKEDFKQMKVIGQFNLGFIIGKLDEDLFIVDQHAADEKYNYERLSQSTILNQQPLFRPITIELSPEEEIVISMHMDIIRRNGFVLEEDMHAPSGHRYKLKAVPFSKNITFGVADIKELISILSDSHGECSIIGSYRSDTADSICPPKVRAMLASRACRTSVMIGDSLGRNEMQKILENLANLKSPWNCPHGRPTMRHLVDLRTIRRPTDEEEEEETVDLS